MSRPAVFAEQFTNILVAQALREHREDRTHLLNSLTASLKSDPRVRAAWLWGSFGRGEADDLSDLDPWIIVPDAIAPEMGSSLRRYAEQTGSFISGGEKPKNGPPGGGYFGSLHEGRHGLLHLDCYWQPQSTVISVPEYAVLFDRMNEAAELPPPVSAPALSMAEEVISTQIEGSLGFAWLMFSIAAKYLARDPASDMGLMFFPKPGLEEAAAFLSQEDALGPADWTIPQEPWEKVARLRHLVGKAEQLRLAAYAQGYAFSPRPAPCLHRYLDLVEGILRSGL